MRFILTVPIVAALVLTGCGSLGKVHAPNQAEAHLGQTLVASSETRTGKSLLGESQEQLLQIELINTELKKTARRANTIQARQLLFEIARMTDAPILTAQRYGPGLKQSVTKALEHVERAANDPTLEQSSRRQLLLTLAKSDELMENIDQLSTYTELGLTAELNSELVELLQVVSREIDDALLRIQGGAGVDAYGISNLRTDVADGTQRDLQSFDTWYFQNFKRQADDSWRYPKRKLLSSNQFRPTGGGGDNDTTGSDDDDRDDDDDDDDDD